MGDHSGHFSPAPTLLGSWQVMRGCVGELLGVQEATGGVLGLANSL